MDFGVKVMKNKAREKSRKKSFSPNDLSGEEDDPDQGETLVNNRFLIHRSFSRPEK